MATKAKRKSRLPVVYPMVHRRPWKALGPYETEREMRGNRRAILEYWNVVDANGFYVVTVIGERDAKTIASASAIEGGEEA